MKPLVAHAPRRHLWHPDLHSFASPRSSTSHKLFSSGQFTESGAASPQPSHAHVHAFPLCDVYWEPLWCCWEPHELLHRMEVEFVSHDEPPRRDGVQRVYALHGPDASPERGMLRALMHLKESALPVMPALLGQPPPQAQKPKAKACCSHRPHDLLAHTLMQMFSSDDARVLTLARPPIKHTDVIEPQATNAKGELRDEQGGAKPPIKDKPPRVLAEGDSRTVELAAAVQAATDADRLNPSQAAALRRAAAWLAPDSQVLVKGCCALSAAESSRGQSVSA